MKINVRNFICALGIIQLGLCLLLQSSVADLHSKPMILNENDEPIDWQLGDVKVVTPDGVIRDVPPPQSKNSPN